MIVHRRKKFVSGEPVVMLHASNWFVGHTVSEAEAARLLAGLEVALAAALREAGKGKCLRCGRAAYASPPGPDYHEQIMCGHCGGILSPMPAREGEG